MRRLRLRYFAGSLAALIWLATPACKSPKRPLQRTDEPIFSSVASAGDPREALQFRKGFYAVEANSWRWTSKHFEVALSPPHHQPGKDVQLVLRFTIPEVILKSLQSIRLSAAINGVQLPPQEYAKFGDYAFVRDVPATQLTGDRVLVDFDLDKALPPTAADNRELGIIVTQVGLIPK